MATTKLMQSTLPEIFQRVLDEDAFIVINATDTASIADTLFEAVTRCLAVLKKKDKAMAFTFEELNGTFIAGAVVEYHDNGDNAGDNWSYIWTFDPTDIPENAHKTTLSDVMAHQYFNRVSYEKYKRATKDTCIANLYTNFLKVLSQWLADNAKSGEVESIVLDGVFEARVAVEGEKIEKSLEVSGELKTLIKDDAAIEK